MKKITLCLMILCLANFLAGQSIIADQDFGVNGLVETDMWDYNLNPYGPTLVVLPDGSSVILAGTWLEWTLEKYGSDGVLDPGFTTAAANRTSHIVGLSIQQDGKFIGVSSTDQAPYDDAVVRVNANGGLDSTFGINGIASVFVQHIYVSHLFQQSNGKIIVFGNQQFEGNTPTVVTRLNTNGAIDSTFGENGHYRFDISDTYELNYVGLEQPDGKLLFAGMASWQLSLFRLNPDGTSDSTFSADGIMVDTLTGGGEAYGLALQQDGKIVVGGYASHPYHPITARYLPNGDRDNTFADAGVQYSLDLNPNQEGVGIAILPDGKIIMCLSGFGDQVLHLTQMLPNGQRDSSFGSAGVYRYLGPNIRPRSFSLNSNTLTVSGRDYDSQKVYLVRFLLDLNVGTLSPSATCNPSPLIYPNPIAGPFTLKFGLLQKDEVSIYLFDMNGKQVQSLVQYQSFENGEQEINLSCAEHLPAGNYILTLEVGGKTKSSIQVTKQ